MNRNKNLTFDEAFKMVTDLETRNDKILEDLTNNREKEIALFKEKKMLEIENIKKNFIENLEKMFKQETKKINFEIENKKNKIIKDIELEKENFLKNKIMALDFLKNIDILEY